MLRHQYGKVVLVPVLVVQKLLKILNGAHAREQTLGKGPLIERKILTFHLAINVGFSRFCGK